MASILKNLMINDERITIIVGELHNLFHTNSRNVNTAGDLIVELAMRLEDLGVPENMISRRIKWMLKDEISKRQITPRWIHMKLPSIYKRSYKNKRESTSLSALNGDTAELRNQANEERNLRTPVADVEFQAQVPIGRLENFCNIFTFLGKKHLWFRLLFDSVSKELVLFTIGEGDGT